MPSRLFWFPYSIWELRICCKAGRWGWWGFSRLSFVRAKYALVWYELDHMVDIDLFFLSDYTSLDLLIVNKAVSREQYLICLFCIAQMWFGYLCLPVHLVYGSWGWTGDIANAQRSILSCSFVSSFEQAHVYMFKLKLLSYRVHKGIPVNEQKQRSQTQPLCDISTCLRVCQRHPTAF